MKICCKCKNEKNLDCFGKLKNSPDGLRYDCKDCRKEYNIKNKEIIQFEKIIKENKKSIELTISKL